MADIEMIDDAYWLKFAKDHITSAIDQRDAAAKKIQDYLYIIWGLYTTVFALATAFTVLPVSHTSKIIMALPVMVIPIANWCCVMAQLPPSVAFYPNIPTDIEQNCYAAIVKYKTKWLFWSKLVSLLSAILIGLSIYLYKLQPDPSKNKGQSAQTACSIPGNPIDIRIVSPVFKSPEKGFKFLAVSGNANPSSEVRTILVDNTSSNTQTSISFCDSIGNYTCMFKIDSSATNVFVNSSWLISGNRLNSSCKSQNL
jgi:hypothetical protein